jgi:hypothetical protein
MSPDPAAFEIPPTNRIRTRVPAGTMTTPDLFSAVARPAMARVERTADTETAITTDGPKMQSRIRKRFT